MAKKNEELTLDDLQEQHRQYAEVIGIDNLLRLSILTGGRASTSRSGVNCSKTALIMRFTGSLTAAM